MPNATVTATDVNTKATRTGETDADGHFLFSQVNPSTYQVTVEAKASDFIEIGTYRCRRWPYGRSELLASSSIK